MTVVILSGGLDSTVLAATHVHSGQAETTTALSFDYGQRHRVELDRAAQVASYLGIEHHTIDLSGVGTHLSGSSLTDTSVDVPDGHYAEASMKATIVPNRNAIMLAVAAGYALAHGHTVVEYGAHAGDHYVYPDCRPEFVAAFAHAIAVGSDSPITIDAPFADYTKADIVRLGDNVDAPMALTWSCYKGDPAGTGEHCGTCGTCVERKEAFHDARRLDPTRYADVDYTPRVTVSPS